MWLEDWLNWILAVALCSVWLLWTFRVWWVNRPPRQQQCNQLLPQIVAYASQTGTARGIALEQQQLLGGPLTTQLVALSELTPGLLSQVKKALFVVSTHGDGEPPDNGRRFYRDLLGLCPSRLSLSSLEYEVLAIGDASYPQFCQFGVDLYQQLARVGATAIKPLQKHQPHILKSAIAVRKSWTLVAREQLTADQTGGLFHLRLKANGVLTPWRAGDLVSILPHNDQDQLPRRYSVASVPDDQQLSLIVRQQVNPDGSLGLCSGWLTDIARLGDEIILEHIDNPCCQIEHVTAPLLLIGAGSGLAGIRGHLAQRRTSPESAPVWLMFGERFDDPHQQLHEELLSWQRSGVVKLIHCAYSRSTDSPAYVQEMINQNSQQIANFIGCNGHVYVCGHYQGMGTAVDLALANALGLHAYRDLQRQNRYHRDLY